MNVNKKILFIGIGILAIVLFIFMISSTLKETSNISIPFIKSPTPIEAPINKNSSTSEITPAPTSILTPIISPNPALTAKTPYSQTNTIINNIKKVDTENDRIIAENDNFTILYMPQWNNFLISITASPFNTNRQLAEQDFLDKLQLSKDQACKLAVTVSSPYFANPEVAGQIFPLSFCGQ
jgi:hypothetical protein